MPVQNDSNRRIYSDGGGGVTSLAFDVFFFDESEIVVAEYNSEGTAIPYVIGTDYTVVRDGENGGTITLTSEIPTGSRIVAYTDIEATQSRRFPRAGYADSKEYEGAADKLTMIVQQIQDELSRVLLKADVDQAVDTEFLLASVAERANKIVSFDADGNVALSVNVPEGAISFANQTEAEAGIENTKAMTSLRVKQAINEQAPALIESSGLLAQNIADHGFSANNLLKKSSLGWDLSTSASAAGARVHAIVTSVADVDNFTVRLFGDKVTVASHGLAIGEDIYLSTSGGYSNTASTLNITPVGWALDDNTIVFNVMRGSA